MANATDKSRLIIPALGGLYEGLADLAYPLLRFCYGAFYVPHGWDKLVNGSVKGLAGYMTKANFPAPDLLAHYIGLLELVGGTLLAIGLLTRLMAIQFIGFMLVTVIFVINKTWFWTNQGMEMPMLLLVIAIVIFIRGGHHWSVDKTLSREF